MKYYPINLDIKGQDCLVVGGGKVGERKVKTLLKAGANVYIVSPDITCNIQELGKKERVNIFLRKYSPQDIKNKLLVIASTDNKEINKQIADDAAKENVLCNVVDSPELCNFILPAIVHQKDLMITVSTGGKSPALSKKIRKKLESEFGEEYSHLLEILGNIRQKLIIKGHAPEEHKTILTNIINSNILDSIKNNQWEEVNNCLKECSL